MIWMTHHDYFFNRKHTLQRKKFEWVCMRIAHTSKSNLIQSTFLHSLFSQVRINKNRIERKRNRKKQWNRLNVKRVRVCVCFRMTLVSGNLKIYHTVACHRCCVWFTLLRPVSLYLFSSMTNFNSHHTILMYHHRMLVCSCRLLLLVILCDMAQTQATACIFIQRHMLISAIVES